MLASLRRSRTRGVSQKTLFFAGVSVHSREGPSAPCGTILQRAHPDQARNVVYPPYAMDVVSAHCLIGYFSCVPLLALDQFPGSCLLYQKLKSWWCLCCEWSGIVPSLADFTSTADALLLSLIPGSALKIDDAYRTRTPNCLRWLL